MPAWDALTHQVHPSPHQMELFFTWLHPWTMTSLKPRTYSDYTQCLKWKKHMLNEWTNEQEPGTSQMSESTQLPQVPALWSWGSCFISLDLRCSVCKMEIIKPALSSCCEIQTKSYFMWTILNTMPGTKSVLASCFLLLLLQSPWSPNREHLCPWKASQMFPVPHDDSAAPGLLSTQFTSHNALSGTLEYTALKGPSTFVLPSRYLILQQRLLGEMIRNLPPYYCPREP